MKPNYQTICSNLLRGLPERVKNVIERRFGFKKGKSETLESIGQNYGITRERVRQIEEGGINLIKRPEVFKITLPVFTYFKDYFKKESGLKREDILLSDLGGERFKPQVFFLLTLGDQFLRQGETGEFYPFWTTNKELVSLSQDVIKKVSNFLKKEEKPLKKENFLREALKELKENLGKKFESRFVLNSVEIAKDIEENSFREIGLVVWPEINPRGMKDKAYIIFKKEGKPLHFQAIADKINQSKLSFQEKPALVQTVHNELIKDPRFVLVGRGVYALSEWGYYPGQVKDVISKILKETKKPLTKEEILEKVLSQRLVKENTILLNLSNKKYFLRNPQGKYVVKEA
jgi:DNA-directed RNA polymerase delta subunit